MNKESNSYARTYPSFCGSNILIILDNEIIAEASSINIDSKKKELTISIVMFSNIIKLHKELIKKENSKLLIIFANEYGFHMHRVIKGIKYSNESIKYSIDDMNTIQNYIFSFEEVNPYEEYIGSVDDLRNQVFK